MAANMTRKPRSRTTIRVPSYRLHKHSGRAVVTLGGRDVYLGPHGSPESRRAYDRLIAEYVAAGGVGPRHEAATLSIDELVLRYWRHAQNYYGTRTPEGTIRPALRRFRKLYGETAAAELGPLRFKAFRDALITERSRHGKPLSRRYINHHLEIVRGMFRWGVGEELVAPSVLHGLEAVSGLRRGRTAAPDAEPVQSVTNETIEATLHHLPTVVADMVRLQRMAGMRPGEVCRINWEEIDATGEVWCYRPAEHKTAHLGRQRSIALGPRCQAILSRYRRIDGLPIFRPSDAIAQRKAERRAFARTPQTPSRRARDAARSRRPQLKLNDAYTTTNYAQAIRRACEAAGINPHWSPNQLRHTKATELRREFGLDAAGAILGHSRLETTQIYAERSEQLAARVARATA